MVNYSKKNKVVTAIIIVSLIGCACFFTGIFPIVVYDNIDSKDIPTEYSNEPSQINTTVNVLESIEFNKVILLIDFGDYDEYVSLPQTIPHKKVLVCTDAKLLNTLKRSSWYYTGGDICTLSSKILFFNGNHLVRAYHILLSERHICIQSGETGLIETVNKDKLQSVFSRFKPYYGLFLYIE